MCRTLPLLSTLDSSVGEQRKQILESLAEALLEAKPSAVSLVQRTDVHEKMAQGLDSLQRGRNRGGKQGFEWRNFADWQLLRRLIATAAGTPDEAALSQCLDFAWKTQTFHDDELAIRLRSWSSLVQDLALALESPVPLLRWVALQLAACAKAPGADTAAANLLTSDSCPTVRALAARALAHLRHPNALSLLTQALGDPDDVAAAGAVFGLGELGTEPAFRHVLSLLQDPREGIRFAAVQALQNFARTRPEAILQVLSAILQDDSPAMRAPAASCVGHCLRALKNKKERLASLQGLLSSIRHRLLVLALSDGEEGTARASACFGLNEMARLGGIITPSEWTAFCDLATDSSLPAPLRRTAVSVLGLLGEAAAVPALLELLWDNEPSVAANVLYALVHLDPQCIRNQVHHLGDGQITRLLTLVRAAEDPRPVTLLLDVLAHPSPTRKASALWALAGLNPKVFGRVPARELRALAEQALAMLADDNPGVRASALGTSGILSETGLIFGKALDIARNQIRACLRDREAAVRASACGALGRCGDLSDILRLQELGRGEPDPKVLTSIRWALYHIEATNRT